MLAHLKTQTKPVVLKIIAREDRVEPSNICELHLQSLINPLKLRELARLNEYIFDDDFIYLIRPEFNRGSLSHALHASKTNLLTEKELRKGAKVVCKALRAIHKVGYLHGDVRP